MVWKLPCLCHHYEQLQCSNIDGVVFRQVGSMMKTGVGKDVLHRSAFRPYLLLSSTTNFPRARLVIVFTYKGHMGKGIHSTQVRKGLNAFNQPLLLSFHKRNW